MLIKDLSKNSCKYLIIIIWFLVNISFNQLLIRTHLMISFSFSKYAPYDRFFELFAHMYAFRVISLFAYMISWIWYPPRFDFAHLSYSPHIVLTRNFKSSPSPIKCQCCPHIETSQLICTANQLTGFCMRATLALNGLSILYVFLLGTHHF